MAEAEARPPFGGLAQGANGFKEQATQKAKEVAGQARTVADHQKDQVASKIGDVAHAFHRTGDELRSQDQQGLSSVTDAIGDQIDRVAGYLQNNDVRAMIGEVQNIARRQPALFIGGMFTLGLLAARFLRSSAQHTMELGDEDLYDLSPTGGAGYGGGSYGQGGAGYGYGTQGSTQYGQQYGSEQYGSQYGGGQYGSQYGGGQQYGGSQYGAAGATTPGYESPGYGTPSSVGSEGTASSELKQDADRSFEEGKG